MTVYNNINSLEELCSSQGVSPSTYKLLQDKKNKIDSFTKSLSYGNISYDTRIAMLSDMKKEKKKFVDTMHSKSIWYNEKMDLWCTKVYVREKDGENCRKVLRRKTAKTREKLYEALYEFYSGEGNSLVMKDLFQETLPRIAGRMGTISDVTRKEYSRLWNKYWLERIGDRELTDITGVEWRRLFTEVITESNMTKKQFGNAVTIVNHIMSYCISQGLIQSNPIRDLIHLQYPFKPEATGNLVKTEGISFAEIEKIREWCKSELERTDIEKYYIYAMLFNIRYGLRFGELTGLKWIDINFEEKEFIIRRQRTRQVRMKDDLSFEELQMQDLEHVKAYEDSRRLPLSEEAIDILQRVRELGKSQEYVFPVRRNTYTDKLIRAVAFSKGIPAYDENRVRNPRLKGIHPHSLRVGAAGSLYQKTKNRKAVQYALGHRNPEMTEKYIKNLEVFDELKDAF